MSNYTSKPQEHIPVDPQLITGNDAQRLGYDVNKIFHVPGGVDSSSELARDYHTNNPEYKPQQMKAEHVNPWVLAQQYDPASGMDVPNFDYVKTGSTVAPGDAVLDEDGRTYHGYKEGSYLMPNDGEEQDRLDLQHHTFKLALDGSLALAPISKPFTGNCLDVATGTGIWALDFAQENPNARVIGADLSQIQPERMNVANCEFVKQDVGETEWILGKDPNPVMFDYIHARMVVSCFDKGHLHMMQNCYNNMNPGGWIEFQDGVGEMTSFDGSHSGTVTERAWSLARIGANLFGRDFLTTIRYKDLLKEAGFVDITESRIMIPTGVWPADPKMKKLAEYNAENMVQVLKSLGKVLMKAGMDQEALEKLHWMLRKEMQNRHLHFEWPFYVVCGRKPLENEAKTS